MVLDLFPMLQGGLVREGWSGRVDHRLGLVREGWSQVCKHLNILNQAILKLGTVCKVKVTSNVSMTYSNECDVCGSSSTVNDL